MTQAVLTELRRRLEEHRRGGPATPIPRRLPARPEPPDVAPLLADLGARHPGLAAALGRHDPFQVAAVLADDPLALLDAHVGSGKTAVLTHKVAYLHLARGVPLEEIMVLTFTLRAAAELRARVAALVGPLAPAVAWRIGTFHGVAHALLQRALPLAALGFAPGFEVLDAAASRQLLSELATNHRLGLRAHTRLDRRLARLRRGGPAAASEAARKREEKLRLLAALFTEEKRRRNVMDFDDLIAHATELLRQAPAAPRWLLVDELQDCEPRELALLRRLRGARTRVFAVGDPHQVIYGWRGSSPGLFAELAAEPGCRVHPLPRSYRSSATILEGARALLADRARPLEATRAAGPPIVVRRHHNPLCEALYLADRIAALTRAGARAGEIAVLFRVRKQGKVLAEILGRQGVPTAPNGGVDGDGADGEGVQLLTLHAAKGLEFRHVFIIGCNDGLIPLASSWRGPSASPEAELEERRLLYVGMTRAIETLELSHTTEPEHPGALPLPSRFLGPRHLGALAGAVLERDPPLPAPTTASAGSWRPGQPVHHPRYGAGTVVRLEDQQVVCVFGKLGERGFDARMCPLRPDPHSGSG